MKIIQIACLVIGSALLYQCNPKPKPVLTHWLQGTWETTSHRGTIVEEWTHPATGLWKADVTITNRWGDELKEAMTIEDKDGLQLSISTSAYTVTLPAIKTGMEFFEFRDDESQAVYRLKLEKVSDTTFRRVSFDRSHGSDEMELLDYQKSILSAE